MTQRKTNQNSRKNLHQVPGTGSTRIETDSLGSKPIPAHAYWGINVSRALDNFAISGRPISTFPDLIYGYACVKQAAARANKECGALDSAKADLIDRACEELKNGELHDQFVVDIIQGGAGTSTNMNANEVIANRGLELAGRPKGRLRIPQPKRRCESESKHERHLSHSAQGRALPVDRTIPGRARTA
jgi:aspartate ammonia-lyase